MIEASCYTPLAPRPGQQADAPGLMCQDRTGVLEFCKLRISLRLTTKSAGGNEAFSLYHKQLVPDEQCPQTEKRGLQTQYVTQCVPIEDNNLVCYIKGFVSIVRHKYACQAHSLDDISHTPPDLAFHLQIFKVRTSCSCMEKLPSSPLGFSIRIAKAFSQTLILWIPEHLSEA